MIDNLWPDPYEPIPAPLPPPQASSSITAPTLLEYAPMRFFETGKNIPLPQGYQYANTTIFPQNTTRVIYYILSLRNQLYEQQDQTYQLMARYYHPDGTLFSTSQQNLLVMEWLDDFLFPDGAGYAEPGHWKPGTYRVEILIDGVKFAEGSFTIE